MLRDIDTGEAISCSEHGKYFPIQYGLDLLSKADLLVGHNFINFDLRAISKVYPTFKIKENCDVHDTLIISRVWAPEIETIDEQKYASVAFGGDLA